MIEDWPSNVPEDANEEDANLERARRIVALFRPVASATEATFSTLREANAARQAEWDAGNQITLAYRGNKLAGEVGEACNIVKKIE